MKHVVQKPRTAPSADVRPTGSPGAGQTIQRLVSPWAHPVLDAYHELKQAPTPILEKFREAFPFYFKRSTALDDHELSEFAASMLIGIWLVARVHHQRPISFAEAEHWFLDGAHSELALVGNEWPIEHTVRHLERPFEAGGDPRDLLPYIMEVFHTGPVGTTRVARRHQRNNRRAKRRDGVFYTPTDVARFIASETLRDLGRARPPRRGSLPNVLDPACGTGVLLAATYDVLCEQVRPASWREASQVVDALYGIDINANACGATALILVERIARTARVDGDPSPLELWQRIGSNLGVFDATNLLDQSTAPDAPLNLFLPERQNRLADVFAVAASGFDIVLGNPPYAYTKQGGGSAAAFLPFVEMMWRFTREGGAAGMVLPLSVTYHSSGPYVQLRQKMRKADGEWRFCSFDRTPDSLFGDDVKTRNTIAFFSHSGSAEEFGTTALMRWNSGSRKTLFRGIQFTRAPVELAQAAIPKLGSPIEVAAYRTLRLDENAVLGMTFRFGNTSGRREDPRLIHVGSTAYNWLPIYRATIVADQPIPRVGLWALACATDDDADAVFAILCSRLLYWLWRVEGDGFHLPKRFITNAPICLDSLSQTSRQSLVILGQRLWRELVKNPVYSMNSGKSSVSFSPLAGEAPGLVQAIDVVLVEALDLPAGFCRYLEEYVHDTVAAGRGSDHQMEPT